ncbi:dnaJ homolog subfamily C member 24 [Bombina bombina]|uniref:dnaJ homolog subfamily C member 24 n=1 Tax=Bombina bombina TaxID=8345 RepID=UPI00235A6AD7|nr:dnaJ homolog subfamily C member 24 [Bombina bombina]
MSAKVENQKDWYSILGAKPTDSQTELKQKYQKLALLYHPDKQKRDLPEVQFEGSQQRFIEISQAWKILGNEDAKREYDLQLRESEMTKMWPVDNQIQLQDMSWIRDEESYSFPCRCGGRYIIAENEAVQDTLVYCDSCSLIIEIIQ